MVTLKNLETNREAYDIIRSLDILSANQIAEEKYPSHYEIITIHPIVPLSRPMRQ